MPDQENHTQWSGRSLCSGPRLPTMHRYVHVFISIPTAGQFMELTQDVPTSGVSANRKKAFKGVQFPRNSPVDTQEVTKTVWSEKAT